MLRIGCRKPIFSFGISMLGPALHKFATEEQKMRFLPDITAEKHGGVRVTVNRMLEVI